MQSLSIQIYNHLDILLEMANGIWIFTQESYYITRASSKVSHVEDDLVSHFDIVGAPSYCFIDQRLERKVAIRGEVRRRRICIFSVAF